MLGSRLSLDRLAEWIEWRGWAVQSSLWADGALAIANKLNSNLPGQSGHACAMHSCHEPSSTEGEVQRCKLRYLWLPRTQIRAYRWCSPPRIGCTIMSPNRSIRRVQGASLPSERCVRTSL